MHSQLSNSGLPCSLKSVISRPLLVHHVAKRLGISRRMVRHLAETGQLPGFKSGKKIWQFFAADVEKFRVEREVRNV
jgi:excisionase family DNA binding protein